MLVISTTIVVEDWCQLSPSVNMRLWRSLRNLMKGMVCSSHFENVNLRLFSNKSYPMTQNANILFGLGNDKDSL